MHKTFVVSILLFVLILVALDQRTIDTLRSKPLIVSSEADPVTGLVKTLPMSALTQNYESAKNSTKELSTELKSLKDKILSLDETAEARQQMLYTLTQKGPSASEALVAIAKSDIPEFKNSQDPHSVAALQEKLELSLRVTALEALDALIAMKPELISKMAEIAHAQSDPILKFLAQVSLSGAQKHQPGKLKRTIDAMLAEAGPR
ncbi:MAG: hypothetical protein H7256_13440 [Bdellovibrio sp.]|nr:hypothetical protein [Bdellovibrio sp.]